MSDWDVNLVYVDGKSRKFWRARADGDRVHVNFGRIGTDGQSQIKEFSDASAASAELDKLARSKRKKGYADDGSAPPKPSGTPLVAPVEADNAAAGPRSVQLIREGGGRKIELRLTADGGKVRTEMIETYESPATAAGAFERIEEALRAEGYRQS